MATPNQGVKIIPAISEKTRVRMIIDTGATINILDCKAFVEIEKKTPIYLKPTT